MSPRPRRAVLRSVAVPFGAALAGCGQSTGPGGSAGPRRSGTRTASEAGVGVTPPGPGECSAVPLPRPTPTDEGLAPMEYPTLPETLTESSAVEFAVAFEKAYQHNRFLTEDYIPGTDELHLTAGVPDGAVRAASDGFAVGVNGELRTADTEAPTAEGSATDTPTRAPSLTSPFSAWYYVTARAALREDHEDGTIAGGADPRFDAPTVVACADE